MILDCSYRLPGPLATSILLEEGHEIIRIEYQEKRDPFSKSNLKGVRCWYKKFNDKKKFYSFRPEDLDSFIKRYKKDIQAAIIDSHSPFLSTLKKNSIKHVVICSTKENKRPMHDLDILAKSGYFDVGSQIPEMPFVGILFAEKIVTEFYKLLFYQKNEIKVFLDDTLRVLNKVHLPPDQRFFSGKVIGYNDYSLKNGRIFLTALEQKSWLVFLEYLSLENPQNVSPVDNVRTQFYETLKKKLSAMTKEDFLSYDQSKKCFTII